MLMRSSSKNRRKLKSIIRIVTAFVVWFYVYLAFFTAFGMAFNEFSCLSDRYLLFRLGAMGFVVGVTVALADVFFLARLTRALNFILTLVVGTLFYVTLSMGVLLVYVLVEDYFLYGHQGVFSVEARLQTFFTGEFSILTFFLVVVGFFINSFRLVIQRVGEKNFWNAVTGRYHIPHHQERVFMFLDLKSSTTMAEKLGCERYHNLLHDVFSDIEEPIDRYKGEVYQYVGDGVVLTWTTEKGVENLNCLRCFFSIINRIESFSRRYEDRYSLVPQLKAGLHSGRVIAGEVGEEKREIVFHGDTVNTASRIQGECNRFREQILFSKKLLRLFDKEQIKAYSPQQIGTILLDGRTASISLYTVSDPTDGFPDS